ncbi:hypothetical protein GQ53DRAFT_871465 [Thozetella sp. PMI_491]|nr:hypothetical protein GQ53DRAFT_871465 [Thozetella sp. PMI_491]
MLTSSGARVIIRIVANSSCRLSGNMTRWHQPSCTDPDVVIVGDSPQCKACNSRPSLEELIRSQSAQGTSLSIPPDEPPGKLNLWWPPAVVYDRAAPDQPGASARRGSQAPANATSGDKVECDASAWPHIYSEPLRDDEFRLICMDASDSAGQLVHVSLETHTHDACPEYETVSYTWGGEEADMSMTSPVYIGAYWDVLFQTKNCFDLLQYIKPPRFGRIAWVDSLCVDQSSRFERSIQVAKMRQIYENCSRVVVFLGPDLITPAPSKAYYRRRRPLFELDMGNGEKPSPKEAKDERPGGGEPEVSPAKLETILKRRYFERLWTIQELVLPPRVMIPIGNTEFWADAQTVGHWSATEKSKAGVPQHLAPAPWLQYISQRSLGQKNMMEMLDFTGGCQTSDVRDRLFGLLGLLPKEAIEDLRPTYAISRFNFLANVPLYQPPHPYPSWVPYWRSGTPWEALFHNPGSQDGKDFVDFIDDNFEGSKCFLNRIEWAPSTSPYVDGNTARYLELGRLQRHHGIRVDASTGAVSIHLVKLFIFPSQPIDVGKYKGLDVFRVSIVNGLDAEALYLASYCDLSSVIFPKMDALYCLAPDAPDAAPLYLVLRQGTRHGRLKLVASVHYMATRRPKDWPPPFHWEELTYSVFDLLSDFRESIKVFMRPFTPTGLVKAYAAYLHLQINLNKEALEGPEFENLYVQLVDDKFSPKLAEDFVEFTIVPDRRESRDGKWQPQDRQYWANVDLPWEWWDEKGSKWRPMFGSAKRLKPDFSSSVRIRISTTNLRDWLKHVERSEPTESKQVPLVVFDSLNFWLPRIRRACELTGESVFNIITRVPLMKDRFMSCHRWNWYRNALVEKFEMDGSTYRVSIV